MDNLIIYAEGFTSIIVDNHENKEWKTELEEIIEQKWFLMKEKNPSLWSDYMVRADKMHKRKNSLHISTSITDYMHHVCTREQHSIEKRANPIFVSANIVTSDNMLAFGIRQNCERGNGELNLISGALDPRYDLVMGEPAIKKGVLREIHEETGLEKNHISQMWPGYVFATYKERSPSFLFYVSLRVDSSYLIDFVDNHIRNLERNPEISGIHIVENNIKAIEADIAKNTYRPSVHSLLENLCKRTSYLL